MNKALTTGRPQNIEQRIAVQHSTSRCDHLRRNLKLSAGSMFDSAKQKIERAENHIADLERQFAAFVAEKPHRFVVQSDPESGDLIVRVKFEKPLPSSFALIIGDAIHNLRCALDHAAWELVGIDHGTQNRYLKFPTGDSRISFEALCNGVVTPSQWVKDAFKITEAFPGGGGYDLYQLHQLDNADKHTVIAPVLRATSHPPFKIVAPNGTVMAIQQGNVLIGGGDEAANFARVQRGLSIELDNDAECPPSIFFRQPGNDGIASPTIATLRRFIRAVRSAMALIEGKVPG